MEGSTPQDPLGPIAAVALEFPDVMTALDRLAEQLGTDMQITRLDRALTEQLNADLGIAVPVGSLMVRNAARTRAAVIDLHTAKVYGDGQDEEGSA